MITLTQEQEQVLQEFRTFLTDPNKQIFILRGAAGSGKTTVIMEMVRILNEHRHQLALLAPTGRAAKVLTNKAQEQGLEVKGRTIHGTIYAYDRIECMEAENPDTSHKNYRYYYPLRMFVSRICLIVDESSMLSDVENRMEHIQFGSGRLLTDLLQAARGDKKLLEPKIVFVGDPAQLPPVGTNKTLALDQEYLESLGYGVVYTHLKTIQRQAEQSGILRAATHIREQFFKSLAERTSLKIEEAQDLKAYSAAEILERYIDLYPRPRLGASVIIAYSNQSCYTYNQSIRSRYYGTPNSVEPSDLLLVHENNWSYNLSNGDIIQVGSVCPKLETRTIQVYVEKIQKPVTLCFRAITYHTSDYIEGEACILESFLVSPYRSLSTEERKALYIDFCIRHPHLKEGSGEFNERLGKDPYFNALRVKYGYALTCHKAQGGEWDTAFVDYSGRTGMDDDSLRWCYTATTRARKMLYGVHLPAFSRVTPREMSSIATMSKPTIPLYRYENIEPCSFPTPYHIEGTHVALRMHYHQVHRQLRGTPYSIVEVQSMKYRERYTISCGEDWKTNINFQYNKDYNFRKAEMSEAASSAVELIRLLAQDTKLLIEVSYTPSTPLLEGLYQRVLAAAQGTGLELRNVEERTDSYYVLYLFSRAGEYAELQFYFSPEKKGITRLNSRSTLGSKDEALQSLINTIGTI